MKKGLIRVLLLFLLFSPLYLYASTYIWSAHTSKKDIFVNEAVYINYSCEFSDRGELYVIDFNPVTSNENYTIKPLSQTSKISNGKRINIYEYIVYFHQAGEKRLEFDVLMKKTNQDSIENTVIGRDNGEYEEFSQEKIKQKTLNFNVKKTTSSLVGDLDLKLKKTETKLNAFEPYKLEILFKGDANFDNIRAFDFAIDGVKVFKQEPKEETELTKHGFRGIWSQKFAFVSQKDFVIPEFKIEYFNLQTEQKEILISKEISVKLNKSYTKEELLDQEEEGFVFDYRYTYYLLSFIAGFLVAKIEFKKEKSMNVIDESFQNKLKRINSLDELVFVLIVKNQKKYQDIITKIENKEITSLKDAKKLI